MNLNKAVFMKPFSIVSYILTLIGIAGIVMLVSNSENPMFLQNWGDILLLMQTAGIIGFLSLIFVMVQFLDYFGRDRSNIMAMTIAITLALLFISMDRYLKIFEPVKSYGIDIRFRLSAGQFGVQEVEDGTIAYIQNPEAHPAIHIVGIDNRTVDAFQGFPFSWSKYADLLKGLHESTHRLIMFDIFFQDPVKDNYGLLEIVDDMRFNIVRKYRNKNSINISYQEMKRRSASFSAEIERHGRTLIDYPFQVNTPGKALLASEMMQKRLRELEKFAIPPENVVQNEHLTQPYEWVTYPVPPIASIGKAVEGLGAANVRYESTGVNHKMPLVFKWKNTLYPSISLFMACEYLGVDLTQDVKVELGKEIVIENIPEQQVAHGPIAKPSDILVSGNPDRSITIPIDHEGMMMINFIGPAFSFPSTSLAEILQNVEDFPGMYSGQNKHQFRDKILLVAMYYATGAAKDIHPGPFGNVAGIEHHANALNTILKQNFITFAPDWINYLIYITIAIILGLIIPRYNMLFVILGTLAFMVIFLVISFTTFNVMNYIHIFLTPYIEMTVVLIAVTGYKVLAEEENVKYIRSTFSKFVSKDVVNELLADPNALKLGGENKEITVFFSDIRGFTTISESLQPVELVSLLNEYLSVMTELVLSYKGTVDKYMGDAIMAFWGAPIPQKDHAYLACLASLKQYKELDKLQKKWEADGVPVIDIGIGLNSGPAVVGNMGSAHRMDYTVMGDTINLGSRLEGTNKVYATNIIISEYTYEQVKEKVITRELDLIKVKGKNEPVKIYELLGVKDEDDFEKYITKYSAPSTAG